MDPMYQKVSRAPKVSPSRCNISSVSGRTKNSSHGVEKRGKLTVSSSHGSTPDRMGHLTDITRSADDTERDTESQDETTSQKHSVVNRWCLNASSDNDDDSASEHSDPTA